MNPAPPAADALEQATRRIAAGMLRLSACPCCGGGALSPLPCPNDLADFDGVDPSIADSDYRLCRGCGVLFAARRQAPATADTYYDWFAHLEHRHYAVYPPPESYRLRKAERAARHLELLLSHGLVAPGATVAHLRCEIGSLQRLLAERLPDIAGYGFEYFETNLRYAREQGFERVARQDPAGVTLPEGVEFDLIVCNHFFTHSLEPLGDREKLWAGLRPGGALFVYGEVDHWLRFTPWSGYFQAVPLNNYHKQLFFPESLAGFLAAGGLEVELLPHEGFHFELIARRPANGECSPAALAREKAAARAPELGRRFRRWRRLREGPLRDVVKIGNKLARKVALGG